MDLWVELGRHAMKVLDHLISCSILRNRSCNLGAHFEESCNLGARFAIFVYASRIPASSNNNVVDVYLDRFLPDYEVESDIVSSAPN